jgi:hypothetical protein
MRDGQHDFDFEIGSWTTRLSRLLRPSLNSASTGSGALSTPSSCRFEQAFSDDAGRSWEVNWIATDTRITRSQ